jgi:hypothetical protein
MGGLVNLANLANLTILANFLNEGESAIMWPIRRYNLSKALQLLIISQS